MWYDISRRGYRLGRSGATSLEFGLMGTVFFLLVLSGLDLARYYVTLHSLHTVLGDAARAAIIDPSLTGCISPATRVAADAPFLQPSLLNLCVNRNISSGLTTITVTASYNFNFLLPNWISANGILYDATTTSF